MNYKWCETKWSWLILTYYPDIYVDKLWKATKIPVVIAGFRPDIWTGGIQNKKQESYQLDLDVRYIYRYKHLTVQDSHITVSASQIQKLLFMSKFRVTFFHPVIWGEGNISASNRMNYQIYIASVFSINDFTRRKRIFSASFGRQRATELTMTEITMVNTSAATHDYRSVRRGANGSI